MRWWRGVARVAVLASAGLLASYPARAAQPVFPTDEGPQSLVQGATSFQYLSHSATGASGFDSIELESDMLALNFAASAFLTDNLALTMGIPLVLSTSTAVDGTDVGDSESGFSDLTLALRGWGFASDTTKLGGNVTVTLPAGKDELSDGSTDFHLTGLLSFVLGNTDEVLIAPSVRIQGETDSGADQADAFILQAGYLARFAGSPVSLLPLLAFGRQFNMPGDLDAGNVFGASLMSSFEVSPSVSIAALVEYIVVPEFEARPGLEISENALNVLVGLVFGGEVSN